MSPADALELTEEQAEAMFRKFRWPDTDGEPVCPHCGSLEHWPLPNQKRYKCKAKGCRKQFSVTSGTPFAHHKMSFRKMLYGIYEFALPAKGVSAIHVSHRLKCDYKTAFVFLHKIREALHGSLCGFRLQGTVEIDGQWFGGYVKPENVKINRLDRRLAVNRIRPRRVVVGLRERGDGGRAVVNVFDGEHEARAWIVERCGRDARIMADEGIGWLELHASHSVQQVNHSERYALPGGVNTNQIESLFSRLRRLEIGTHHHIAGPYLLNYAANAAWLENNRAFDDRRKTMAMLGAIMTAPRSRAFSGYWQRHGGDVSGEGADFFANFR